MQETENNSQDKIRRLVPIDEKSQVSKRGNKRTCKNGFQCLQNKKAEHPEGAQGPTRVTTTEDEFISASNSMLPHKTDTVNSNSSREKVVMLILITSKF